MPKCMAEADLEEETMTSVGVTAHTEGLEKAGEATGAGVEGETAAQLEAAAESSSTVIVGGSEVAAHLEAARQQHTYAWRYM